VAKTLNLYAVSAAIQVHWGFRVALPLYTATQPTFKIPPPTTLLGALAYQALRTSRPEVIIEGGSLLSSTVELLNVINWVTGRFQDFNPKAAIEVIDLTRYITTLGVRTGNLYPGSPYIWAVQGRGKVYLPSVTLEAVYLTRDPESVERWATGIWRLGSRECPVSVVEVNTYPVELAPVDVVTTSFMLPEYLVKEVIEGDYIQENLPEPSREWYVLGVKDPLKLLKRFIIPSTSVKVRVDPDKTTVLRDSKGDYYIVPKATVIVHGRS
jgi:CRISPR-associated protein Cas5a/b/c